MNLNNKLNPTEKHFDEIFADKAKIEYQLDIRKMGSKDKRIVDLLERHGVKGKNCLDVGPGTGRWIKFLRQMGAKSITALDISDQAIDKCLPFCDEIKKIDIEKEPFDLSSNSFDIVISFEVLEHLYDPAHYLTEMLRVMDDDAFLVMSTPNMTSLISRIRMLLGELPVTVASDPTHVRFYRKKDIKGLFKKFNLHTTFLPTSISLNPLNPKSQFCIPSFQLISSLDDSLVFYTYKRKSWKNLYC